MSRQRSYQLLDQGRAIQAIAAASGVSDLRHAEVLNSEQARDIKPVLPQVTQQIRERVADLGPALLAVRSA
ncbi:hypothetical protein [Microbispora sp. CSR-4]|uniref:hypothetical protein n=1 Tax=Microbispora sp. CSR-4 TaxID=2592813 RepID=UPI0011CB8F1D|nr:hypothetical protein [Microbispora sp. CSR-4]